MGVAITASDGYMAALDGRNYQADQIVQATHVVLRVIAGPLIPQREVRTLCYLLHRLLGPQFPLVESLQPYIAGAIDEEFSSFSMQITMSHRCTAFAYDVSCIIGNYLNTRVKSSATVFLLYPGGRNLVSLQYLKDKLGHVRYVGRPLPSYLITPLLICNTEKAAESRRVRYPTPGLVNSGADGGSNLGAGRCSGGSGGTPRQQRIPYNGDSDPNPHLIQRL